MKTITRHRGGVALQGKMTLYHSGAPAGVKRVTRITVMSAAAHTALARKAPTTLYVINDAAPKGSRTAHRWPVAADTATGFFLGATAVTPTFGAAAQVFAMSVPSSPNPSDPDIMIYFGTADPGDYTVFQVKKYADAVWADTVNNLTDQQKTDEIQRVLDLERAGQDRSSLTTYLDGFPGVI